MSLPIFFPVALANQNVHPILAAAHTVGELLLLDSQLLNCQFDVAPFESINAFPCLDDLNGFLLQALLLIDLELRFIRRQPPPNMFRDCQEPLVVDPLTVNGSHIAGRRRMAHDVIHGNLIAGVAADGFECPPKPVETAIHRAADSRPASERLKPLCEWRVTTDAVAPTISVTG
jgi:hypothetical protein